MEDLDAFARDLSSATPRTLGSIFQRRPGGLWVKLPFKAVYLFTTPDDQMKFYIGISGTAKTQGLRGRLRWHWYSTRSKSDLRGIILCHPQYPQRVEKYLVRWLSLEDFDTPDMRHIESGLKRLWRPEYDKQIGIA